MLLNLVLLARTAKSFEDSLARALPEDGEARETFRMRIENTLFVQLLVGGRLERQGINAKLLSLMSLITFALAPVALLLFLEIKFLPYHNEPITWLHRSFLALDLMLVWTLWPGYRSGWGVRLWPKRFWTFVWPSVLSAVALPYGVLVATFPDEHMYVATNWLHGSPYLDLSTGKVSSRDRPKWHDWIAPVNTLDLQGEDLIDDAKLAHIIEKNESSSEPWRWEPTLSLRGRNLTGADLSVADVQHVEFSGAILNRADLGLAWVKKASLDGAQLQGASLDGAQLQGASLDSAQIQGASLDDARLQGASLYHAQLQRASLDRAQLQGARLEDAQIMGASLDGARLMGASLLGAQLQGASLNYALLQGVSLDSAELQGASLMSVCAWRTDARYAIWTDTRVVAPETGAKVQSLPLDGRHCNWSAASFEELKKLIAEQVPEGNLRRVAMKRIEQNLDPTKALEGEEEMAQVWADHERSSPTQEVYKRSLAKQLRGTGCAADGAPYVVRALLHRLDDPKLSPFAEDSPEKPKLAAAFLDKDCAGARGLSEAEIAKLKAIRDRAPPPAPKP